MNAPGKPWLSECLPDKVLYFSNVQKWGTKTVFLLSLSPVILFCEFQSRQSSFPHLFLFPGVCMQVLRKGGGRAAICKPLLFVASEGLFPSKDVWLCRPHLHAAIPPSSRDQIAAPCKEAAQWKHRLSASWKQPWTTQPHRSYSPSQARVCKYSRILPLLYLLLSIHKAGQYDLSIFSRQSRCPYFLTGSHPKKWATLDDSAFLLCPSFFPHEMAD